MYSSTLQLFTLLVLALAAYGIDGNNNLNYLLSENVGDTKSVQSRSEERLDNSYASEEEFGKYINNQDPRAPPIYNPTPVRPTLPPVTIGPSVIPTLEEEQQQLPKPQKPIELPKPTPSSIPSISLPTSKPSAPTSKPTSKPSPKPVRPSLPTVTIGPSVIPTLEEEQPQLPKPQKPVELPKPTPSSIPSLPTSKPTIPTSKPVLVPPTAPIDPTPKVPICGKKGNCYQWFDDEWQIPVKGYKKCDPTNERRARRYCCAE